MRIRSLTKTLPLAVIAALVACSNPFAGDGATRIRLRNASTFELTSVTFAPGAARLEFARIAPAATTEYAAVEDAYRYGFLDVVVDGARRVIQPIDYVGENVIGGGEFTYVITVDPTTRNPSVQLVRDN